jgi:ubiquinone/menaquinone biosynthesis C-methylase UbiE
MATAAKISKKLMFENESIDLHVMQDVFEHLFTPSAAFREIARTLRAGGAHVFTTRACAKDRTKSILRDNCAGRHNYK